ncbi:hypothetical protein MCAP1_001881 [Malassezia caprae]|uniref:CREG-like beta-barrel domain-containing protein n=1 Tax=Malassezia caprae TaxID=1381934 RepID=A0AAF0J040_9BASI|nr:hypothetical protein MCAP1_001881 [Malassezia caprae]
MWIHWLLLVGVFVAHCFAWESNKTAAHDARTLLVDEQTHYISSVATVDEDHKAVLAYEYYAPCFEDSHAADLLYLVLPVSQLWHRVLAASPMTATVAVASSPSVDDVDLRHANVSRSGRIQWDPMRPMWRRGMASKSRLTMSGTMHRLAMEPAEMEKLSECFVAHHPDARMWLPGSKQSPHTAFWLRFSPSSVYYVGGFGDEHFIGNLDMDAFRAAVPGPCGLTKSPSVYYEQGDYTPSVDRVDLLLVDVRLMSVAAANAATSMTAKMAVALVPVITSVVVGLGSPKAATLMPLAFLPTVALYCWWVRANRTSPENRGELEPLIWTYLIVGIGGTLALSVAQLSTYFVLVSLTMGPRASEYWTEFLRGTVEGLSKEQRQRRFEMASSWQHWVLMFLFSYVMAGGFEELLKYMPVLYARRRVQRQQTLRGGAYIDYALAGAMSIVTVECIGYISDTCASGIQGWVEPIVTLAQRLVAGTLGHVLASLLTSLRAVRSDFYGPPMTWIRIIAPAVVLHGTANLAVFVSCTMQGHVGWVHPTEMISIVGLYGNYFCVVGLVGLMVWREYKTLKEHIPKQ